jgi:uncharacterized protein DUF4326
VDGVAIGRRTYAGAAEFAVITIARMQDVKDQYDAATRTWADGYIYIGRFNSRYRLFRSPWYNPYQLPPNATTQQRAACLSQYRAHLEALRRDNPVTFRDDLRTLRGKTLVCWCKTEHEPPAPDEPYVCHGDILREFVERYG